MLIRLPLTLIVVSLFAILGPFISSAKFSLLSLTVLVFCGAIALATAVVSDLSEDNPCEKDKHIGTPLDGAFAAELRLGNV